MKLFKGKYGWQVIATKKNDNGEVTAKKYINVRFVKIAEPKGYDGQYGKVADVGFIKWWPGCYQKKDGSVEVEFVVMDYSEDIEHNVSHETTNEPGRSGQITYAKGNDKVDKDNDDFIDSDNLPFY